MAEYISESLSMQLGAEFTLLRTPLFAGVKKNGADGYERSWSHPPIIWPGRA